jgi:Sulfotransferase family
VHIARDGRPLAFSLRPKFERKLDRHDALLAAARHWVDVLERTHATPGIDLLEVRYEDLCEDVHGVIRTVLRHAGLDTESFPFWRCPPKLSARNARWVERATIEELAEVFEIQRDPLIRYGYPTVLPAVRGAA